VFANRLASTRLANDLGLTGYAKLKKGTWLIAADTACSIEEQNTLAPDAGSLCSAATSK
jgi:hypothetical protein